MEPDPPYPSALGADEFRLICLEAASSSDDPIHLMLEVYSLESCPEYETVSYTWTGENGDSRLCKPIYIGKYWDVLLQTNNCWEMLRFMRPRRWPRLIWVDAICINQSNILERNMQVAIMAKIYSACSRVVVYLGPQIAWPLHDRHPRRRRLHELESGTVKPDSAPSQQTSRSIQDVRQPSSPPQKLSELLKLRYFSRIWVIQELLLARSIVIRVGDVDFWADVGMTSHFLSKLPNWNWGATSAAWVQHISKGRGSVTDLKELLSLTSLSQATDPRDRIFALLGIMPVSSPAAPENKQNLTILSRADFQADYSLSCQHVFIGLFAYCLINLKQSNILYHATCLSSDRRHFPSWTPDWTAKFTWRILFHAPNLTIDNVFHELRRLVTEGYWCGEVFHPPVDGHLFELYSLYGPGNPDIVRQRRWDKDAYIDAASGSLNVYLTQYMYLMGKLEIVGKLKKFYIFAARYETITVFLVSEHRIDTILSEDDQIELFVLNNNDDTFTYLLLRYELTEDGEEAYSLVSACPYVFVQFPADRNKNEVPEVRPLFLHELQYSLHDFAMRIESKLESYLFPWNMRAAFPGLLTFRDAMPAVRFLYEQHGELQKTGDAKVNNEVAFACNFSSCIDEVYSPRVEGDSIIITVSTAWKNTRDVYITQAGWVRRHLSSEVPSWRIRVHGSEDGWRAPVLSPFKYRKLFKSGQESFFDVQFKAREVQNLILTSPDTVEIFRDIDELSFHTGETDDSLWELITSGASEKYQFQACPHLKFRSREMRTLCEEINVDGGTFMVTII
ncbi:unnamed protein product [Clonostachys rosea]|uniref:Heterokaryon incompatibility domain-containing protein n=1 Tax=Bionectria ochroleuca TaxID=29856 RepID=A0ABY6V3F5_BIOOC|nr:unnamed protein product [Clonostachys rosea]